MKQTVYIRGMRYDITRDDNDGHIIDMNRVEPPEDGAFNLWFWTLMAWCICTVVLGIIVLIAG